MLKNKGINAQNSPSLYYFTTFIIICPLEPFISTVLYVYVGVLLYISSQLHHVGSLSHRGNSSHTMEIDKLLILQIILINCFVHCLDL